MREQSLRFVLLGSLLTLGACSSGPYRTGPELSQTYACEGADPMYSYSECDKPDRFERHHEMDHHEDMDHHDADMHYADSHSAASWVESSKVHR